MIIGSGMIAHKLMDHKWDKKYLFFASGVANSKSVDAQDYEREAALLANTIKANNEKTLVYFSTCSILDELARDSPYVQHKLRMEKLIVSQTKSFRIFRVSNIVGENANKSTVMAFFYTAIKHQRTFELWKNTYRNLIDIDDFINMLKSNLTSKNESTISYIFNEHSIAVEQIVSEIEVFLCTKAKFKTICYNRASSNHLNLPPFSNYDYKVFTKPTVYLQNLLVKYYYEN